MADGSDEEIGLFVRRLEEMERRKLKAKFAQPGGLLEFVRYCWSVIEPGRPMIDGWVMEAICDHLEAVTDGRITRLLINVPPGFSKSLITNVFWPLWEWSAKGRSNYRYVTFSYAAHLTERDNRRFLDLCQSQRFLALYGAAIRMRKAGEVLVSNTNTGWKFATSVKGTGTGERGDRVVLDDPHNIKEQESDVVRAETVRWFREAMSNRLNDMDTGAIVVIMQRLHKRDVSGEILATDMGYVHLCIPMEFDRTANRAPTAIGWVDPRRNDGELAWPERFSKESIRVIRATVGEYAYAGQYQQTPEVRGGSIFKRDDWQIWREAEFPDFDLVIASADTAFTANESNDPTGFTVWGVFTHKGFPKVMLITAWRKWLKLHGHDCERRDGETRHEWERRTKEQWGLVEWIANSCERYRVDKLIIEGKASGLDVLHEIQRLYGNEPWSVDVQPVKGDKGARAHAVQPMWANGLIWVPEVAVKKTNGESFYRLPMWAEMVVDEMAMFPKGHDDLTDSATQAIKFLRINNHIASPGEIVAADIADASYQQQEEPIYCA